MKQSHLFEQLPEDQEEFDRDSSLRLGHQKLRRVGALAGLVAVMAGVGVAKATNYNVSSNNARISAPSKANKINDHDPRKEPITGHLIRVKKAIEKLNKSKEPNIFYGAVVLKASKNPKKATTVYTAPNKPGFDRGAPRSLIDHNYGPDFDLISSEVLVDPRIVVDDGISYFVAYDRGGVPELRLNLTGLNAGTGRPDLLHAIFVPINEAKNRGGIEIYQHRGYTPRMVHGVVTDGYVSIKEKLPVFTEVGEYAGGFNKYERDSERNLTMQDYFRINSLVPAPRGYKPPF